MPSGYRIALELRPGYFFGSNQGRHEAKLRYLGGLPIGPMSVVMINMVTEAVNSTGNPNHSLLLGSITGVRGLLDTLYRNQAQAYANCELRHAVQVAPRWAVQAVMFTDFGTFPPFSDTGRTEAWMGAVSVGAGGRIVPTFLSNTLLGIDVARLISPSPNTLVQCGKPCGSRLVSAPVRTSHNTFDHLDLGDRWAVANLWPTIVGCVDPARQRRGYRR